MGRYALKHRVNDVERGKMLEAEHQTSKAVAKVKMLLFFLLFLVKMCNLYCLPYAICRYRTGFGISVSTALTFRDDFS